VIMDQEAEIIISAQESAHINMSHELSTFVRGPA